MTRIDAWMDRITAWAEPRQDIFAVVVVGSYGRADPPPDRWSDLDLVVFVADPAPYVEDAGWLEDFGTPVLRVLDRADQTGEDSEWLVVYADGVKVDFVFAQADPRTAAPGAEALIAQSMHTDAFGRGARILFDRAIAANAGRFIQRPRRARPALTEQQLAEHLHRTWMDALRAAKLIRRRDLFRAFMDVNTTLKLRLLRLAEWHAQAVHGSEVDMWYAGRHLDRWADARLLAALPETVGGYDASDLARALERTLDAVRGLAREIADRRGFTYPEDVEAKVWGWLREQRSAE